MSRKAASDRGFNPKGTSRGTLSARESQNVIIMAKTKKYARDYSTSILSTEFLWLSVAVNAGTDCEDVQHGGDIDTQ